MPKKPKNDCPLFPHQNGQWCKKIRGKPHYFGTDKDAALKKWAADKDYLLAGREVPRKDSSPAISELGNVFHDRLSKRVERGEITQRSLDDYTKTINRLIDFIGKDCRPERLRPADYASIKDRLFSPVERTTAIKGGVKGRAVERRSPTTVAGDVRRIRAFLNWCYKNELIEVAPRYGTEFSPITEGRPSPAGSENANRLFLTRVGLAWVRRDNKVNHDSLSKAFRKARDNAGVARGSLYDFRRTFRTVADEVRDTAAIQAVMGHAASRNDMDSTYRQRIADDRLLAVCEHVRTWLFGSTARKRVAG